MAYSVVSIFLASDSGAIEKDAAPKIRSGMEERWSRKLRAIEVFLEDGQEDRSAA